MAGIDHMQPVNYRNWRLYQRLWELPQQHSGPLIFLENRSNSCISESYIPDSISDLMLVAAVLTTLVTSSTLAFRTFHCSSLCPFKKDVIGASDLVAWSEVVWSILTVSLVVNAILRPCFLSSNVLFHGVWEAALWLMAEFASMEVWRKHNQIFVFVWREENILWILT